MKRNLRIITGLLLYIFIACHLLNVSLGIFSAELVEQTRPYFMYVWSSRLGGSVLLVSLLVHAALGLQVLYQRNTLQMSVSDGLQFASGFLILPLMIPHVWGVIAMVNILNTPPTYPVLMHFFWIDSPLEGLRQVLLLMIVWVHGSIGIFTWLQLKTWWPRVSLFTYPLIVLVPVLALLGFVEGGNLAIRNFENPVSYTDQQNEVATPYAAESVEGYGASNDAEIESGADDTFAENYAYVQQVKWIMIFVYAGILALVLIARWWRLFRQDGVVSVVYDNGMAINAVVGKTFLELSKTNNIPHANLCRGRGRCGTCRIRILKTSAELPEPTQLEKDALLVTKSDTDVRLACQCIPGAGEVRIERLFEPDIAFNEFRQGQKSSNTDPAPEGALVLNADGEAR